MTSELSTWAGPRGLSSKTVCLSGRQAKRAAMEERPSVHERVGMLVYRRELEEGEQSINYCYLSRNMLKLAWV